jgi:hypothetical protein
MKKLLLLLPLLLGAYVLQAGPETADPNSPDYDPAGDFDGDGFLNGEEIAGGSDPLNDQSTPDPEGEGGEVTEGEGEEVGNRTPVVENVTAGQVAGTKTMEIFYDLKVSDGHPCTVTVKWSTDNGDSYPLTATAVVGDAGPGVDSGSGLRVTWDMGKDWNDKFTQKGRIKVIASRIPHDYVPSGGSETGGHSETGK